MLHDKQEQNHVGMMEATNVHLPPPSLLRASSSAAWTPEECRQHLARQNNAAKKKPHSKAAQQKPAAKKKQRSKVTPRKKRFVAPQWQSNEPQRQFLKEWARIAKASSAPLKRAATTSNTKPLSSSFGREVARHKSTSAQLDSDDDDDEPDHPCVHVERCQNKRKGMHCQACQECLRFYEVLKKTGHEIPGDFADPADQMGRHRSPHPRPDMPPNFWDLDFQDEKQDDKQEGASQNPCVATSHARNQSRLCGPLPLELPLGWEIPDDLALCDSDSEDDSWLVRLRMNQHQTRRVAPLCDLDGVDSEDDSLVESPKSAPAAARKHQRPPRRVVLLWDLGGSDLEGDSPAEEELRAPAATATSDKDQGESDDHPDGDDSDAPQDDHPDGDDSDAPQDDHPDGEKQDGDGDNQDSDDSETPQDDHHNGEKQDGDEGDKEQDESDDSETPQDDEQQDGDGNGVGDDNDASQDDKELDEQLALMCAAKEHENVAREEIESELVADEQRVTLLEHDEIQEARRVEEQEKEELMASHAEHHDDLC